MKIIENIEFSAIIQFQKELNNLENTIKENPLFEKLAETILSLRNLSFEQKYRLEPMFQNGFLDCIKTIMNSDEYLRVPNLLEYLLNEIEWNIEDDGILWIARIESVSTFSVKMKHSEKSSVRYFLVQKHYCNGCKKVFTDIAKNGECGYVLPQHVLDFKIGVFSSIEKFIDFIKILTDKENYDSSTDYIKNEKIDKLINFENT